MSHDAYTQRIRWTTRRPGRSGDVGEGELAGVTFRSVLYSNGDPSSSAWKVRVETPDGRETRCTGHVGGMRAAQGALSDTIRHAVALYRGDEVPA